MKIYADPISINCRKVLAGLQLMEIDYELVHTDYFKSEQQSPEFLALNPNAALPAMTDGDFVLWESNAILQYAADKNSKAAFYPVDLQTRTDINRWALWETGSWFPSCYKFLVENCVKPLLEADPDPAVLEAENDNFHKLASILDQRLGSNDWLAGNSPTIADVIVAAPMHLHDLQKLPLSKHKNLSNWMTNRVEKLPAWENTYVGPGFSLERPA